MISMLAEPSELARVTVASSCLLQISEDEWDALLDALSDVNIVEEDYDPERDVIRLGIRGDHVLPGRNYTVLMTRHADGSVTGELHQMDQRA